MDCTDGWLFENMLWGVIIRVTQLYIMPFQFSRTDYEGDWYRIQKRLIEILWQMMAFKCMWTRDKHWLSYTQIYLIINIKQCLVTFTSKTIIYISRLFSKVIWSEALLVLKVKNKHPKHNDNNCFSIFERISSRRCVRAFYNYIKIDWNHNCTFNKLILNCLGLIVLNMKTTQNCTCRLCVP